MQSIKLNLSVGSTVKTFKHILNNNSSKKLTVTCKQNISKFQLLNNSGLKVSLLRIKICRKKNNVLIKYVQILQSYHSRGATLLIALWLKTLPSNGWPIKLTQILKRSD